MQQVVGRNEPCPCGSGKKYKKCCAKKQVVSIQGLLVTEQMDLQLQFLNEKMVPQQRFFKQDVAYAMEQLDNAFSEPQFLTVFMTFMFGMRKRDGGSHWQHYLAEREATIERPRLRDMMKNWAEPTPVMGEVIRMEESTREITLRDFVSKEDYTVILPEFHQWAPIDYLFAALMPFEDKWVPFGFMFPAIYTKEERDIVLRRLEAIDLTNENRPTWTDTKPLVEIVKAIIQRPTGEEQTEAAQPANETPKADTDWLNQMTDAIDNQDQSETIESLKNYWDEKDSELSLVACHLASAYFEENGARIRKPQPYAAAVTYLLGQHTEAEALTQKEAGEAFDVAANSVSSAARKMDEWLQEELKKLQQSS